MRALVILLLLWIFHTLPLWNTGENLAGGFGDPMAHASMPGWYCRDVLTWRLHTDQFFAPAGADLHNNYDSGFPLILTCPLLGLGPQAQFHFFAAIEILLVILSSLLVARWLFPTSTLWQLAYVGFSWWTGFYMARIHQHYTLLAGIWGFQTMLWVFLTLDWHRRWRVVCSAFLLGLVFVGTFHNVAMLTVPFVILLGHSFIKIKWNRGVAVNVTFAAVAMVSTFLFFFMPTVVGFLSGELPRAFMDRGLYNLDLASPFLPWQGSALYSWLGIQSPIDFERYNGLDLIIPLLIIYAWFKGGSQKPPMAWAMVAIIAISGLSALGPQLRWWGEVLSSNPLDELLVQIPPFSLSRTPARFFVVSVLGLIYLAFAFWAKRESRPGWLAPVLIAWVALSGPVANGLWFVPVVKYQPVFPMSALNQMAEDPSGIVLTVPTALASDPSQNFMQLIHHHPITGGYLAYTAHTPKNLAFMSQDPILSQMNCEGWTFAFRGDGILANWDETRAHLLKTQIRYVIVKKMLLGQPQCQKILGWVVAFARQPWVRPLEENEKFVVLQIQ